MNTNILFIYLFIYFFIYLFIYLLVKEFFRFLVIDYLLS
jgi:hypothetical protein